MSAIAPPAVQPVPPRPRRGDAGGSEKFSCRRTEPRSAPVRGQSEGHFSWRRVAMPRPGDWDAIGLVGDPTPGDPEKIKALADGLQKMGGKAREIITAIEAVMNKNSDSVFVGKTADALRGKVDGRLRGHVEDVASAFETSAQALRDWREVVISQQSKADAALAAGRGLAEDDPNRDTHKETARSAGEYQSDQDSGFAGKINGVADIQLPISECEAFWEAFKWLAIILIIPALIF